MKTPKPGLALADGGSWSVDQRTKPRTSILVPLRSGKTMRTSTPTGGRTLERTKRPSFETFLMWPLPRIEPASNEAGIRLRILRSLRRSTLGAFCISSVRIDAPARWLYERGLMRGKSRAGRSLLALARILRRVEAELAAVLRDEAERVAPRSAGGRVAGVELGEELGGVAPGLDGL